MSNNHIWIDLKNFFANDHIGPFLLMVNAIVYCFMLISIGTTESYLLLFFALLWSIMIQYWIQDDKATIDNKSYTAIGFWMLMYGICIHIAIQQWVLLFLGRWKMALMLAAILFLCYIIAHSYLFFIQSIASKTWEKQGEESGKEIASEILNIDELQDIDKKTFTKSLIWWKHLWDVSQNIKEQTKEFKVMIQYFLLTWKKNMFIVWRFLASHVRVILSIVCILCVLWVAYYYGYLSFLSVLRRITSLYIILVVQDYRYFAFAALICLLLTIAILLIPHEPYANIAATYCYYYLCATVIYALFDRTIEWD